MNHFQKLPHELQINIFNRIEDKAQLAACRLVCKQWDSIAEKAIFSKELVIKDDENFITKLYNHLANKPALTLFIKSINISDCSERCSAMYEKLLKLVMTPSLEQIQGRYRLHKARVPICQIILNSPHKFNRIKRIPVIIGYDDLSYQCLCALRNSLEHMDLSMYEKSNMVLDHLNEFTKLDYLELVDLDISDIMKQDYILCRLKNVTKLILRSVSMAKNFIPKSSDQMSAWLAQNVEKDERLKSITEMESRGLDQWCDYVEYLVYKCPNLHSLKLNLETFPSEDADINPFTPIPNDANIKRILQATKHIPRLILEETYLDSVDDLRTVGHMMKSSSNTVKIECYDRDQKMYNEEVKIEKACREDDIEMSQFSVIVYPEDHHTYIRQFLSSIGSGTSKIIKVAIDLDGLNDEDVPQELTLYDLWRLTPDVQNFEIKHDKTKYQELGSENLVLHDLQHLKFHAAKLDCRVLSQLASIAPNLDRLTISNCLVDQRWKNYTVFMPDSSLSFLLVHFSINWKNEFDESESTEEQANKSIYLCIKTELHPETYYVWRPKDATLATTSKKDYVVRANPELSADIECKSLSSLSLKYLDFKMMMQFEHGVWKSH